MDIFFATFKSVAILMGIGLIGFWILAKKIVPLDILKVLTPLVLEVALPCMIFSNIVKRFDPASMPDWWQLPLWWLAMIGLFLALTIIGMAIVDRQNKGEVGISLLFPNATFFPLGIIPVIFGVDSPILVQLFIFTLLMPILAFNGYGFFFSKKKQSFSFKDSKILNPILVSTIVAILVKLSRTDQYIPDFIITIITLVGATTLPLIMMTIGGNVYVDFQRRGIMSLKSTALFVVIKNLVFPAVTLLFLIIVQPPKIASILIFIQSFVPPLSAVPVLTGRANGNTAIVNQFLISSFLFSIITIPIAMLCYSYFFELF